LFGRHVDDRSAALIREWPRLSDGEFHVGVQEIVVPDDLVSVEEQVLVG
jgi:hypothetical protein